MQKFLFSLFITIIFNFSSTVKAQAPQVLSASDILLGLKKLNVLGSVLYVGAHPDDENTRLLAYFAKEKLYRTGYLSLTRGDGGQNLIGNEQGFELGLVRTQELLAARRIDGAEQFFSRAYDFGFSKSTDEALRIWNKDKILSDVVWVIRRFRPDIIITRFPQDSRAGHGHHSASAVLAVEAFTAAADPSKFPEQLKYVKTWQAKRVLWNSFNFGTVNTTSEEQFKFDVGMYNPVLGKGYGEIAAESRSQHKSQGFGVAGQRGSALEYFSLWKGTAPKNDIMDEVNVSWSRIKGGDMIRQKIDSIISSYSLFTPGASVKALVNLYKTLSGFENDYWKDQKLKEIQQLIEACSGLWVEASTSQAYVVQSDSLRINLSLNNRNGNAVTLKKITMEGLDTSLNAPLTSNRNLLINKSIFIPPTKPVTQPYWLEHEMKQGSFDVTDQLLIGNADTKPSIEARFELNIEGQDFVFVKPVRYKFTDPVKGEKFEPVYVYPKVVVYPIQKNVFLDKDNTATINMQFRSYMDTQHSLSGSDKYSLKVQDSTSSTYTSKFLTVDNHSNQVSFSITQKKDNIPEKKETVELTITTNGNAYSKDLKEIKYDHIPTLAYFPDARANVIKLDLKTVGKKIGYIDGAGDYIPSALRQMGYDVTFLTDNDLGSVDLNQFDAIITGVRAYNIKESLNAYYERIMRYVEEGGNLIVQYNTSNQIGPVKAKIGPYPFNISRNRVTDEDATVKILKPAHPILNYPNKITDKDFEGWVQERSQYHAQNWDSHYETIFSMHDPNEPDDEGSLITAQFGKGNFVYTGMVFYRELPAGVPGAYRLLANLIALNKKKGF